MYLTSLRKNYAAKLSRSLNSKISSKTEKTLTKPTNKVSKTF